MIPDLNLKGRTIGLNFTSGKDAVFYLWAPLANKIEINVNDRLILSPEKTDFGYWEIKTDRISPGDNYSIKLNETELIPDPASLSQPDGVHGHSKAFDLNSFKWGDHEWKGLESSELILYELHTGTFTQEGTFSGIEKKISYLKELGITAIEIMPVAQFPGSRNWGYDGVYPFAVQNSYGGASGLQKLVNTFHKNGLAVVLDVVYNHLGPEGNYLNLFAPYFTERYKTPWGSAINFDDAWSDGVRRFYAENMLMWFRDFHIDALRLDAIHAIKDFSARHIIRELKENAAELEKLTGRKHLLIGETDLNDTRFISPPEKCGFGLDMQWCDEFHHSLHTLVTGERQGYYSDFGDNWQIVKSFTSAYVYDGIYSPHRKKTFGSKTTGIPGNKFVVFIQNHDHIGNRMMGDRLSNLVGFEILKLLAGAMFVSSFVPLIFMGEEYAAANPFFYFTSHSDKELIELVRKGRAEEFSDFIDASKVPDPHSGEIFEMSILDFDISGRKKSIFAFYRELIRLKRTHPVWKEFDRSNDHAYNIGTKGIVFSRNIRGSLLVAAMNFDNQKTSFRPNLPLKDMKEWHVLINSSEQKWGGTSENGKPVIKENEIKIEPSSIIVLSDIT